MSRMGAFIIALAPNVSARTGSTSVLGLSIVLWLPLSEIAPPSALAPSLDPGNAADFLVEEIDEEAHPCDAGALRHDEHAERGRGERVIGQDLLEAPFRQEVIDQPSMGRRDASPGDQRRARREPVIDEETPGKGHLMALSGRTFEEEDVASRHIGHAYALMPGEVARN